MYPKAEPIKTPREQKTTRAFGLRISVPEGGKLLEEKNKTICTIQTNFMQDQWQKVTEYEMGGTPRMQLSKLNTNSSPFTNQTYFGPGPPRHWTFSINIDSVYMNSPVFYSRTLFTLHYRGTVFSVFRSMGSKDIINTISSVKFSPLEILSGKRTQHKCNDTVGVSTRTHEKENEAEDLPARGEYLCCDRHGLQNHHEKQWRPPPISV